MEKNKVRETLMATGIFEKEVFAAQIFVSWTDPWTGSAQDFKDA